jgi:hypothetical protein
MFDKQETLWNIVRPNRCVFLCLYRPCLLYLYVLFVVVSTAGVAEPQASVDIPVVSDLLIPVSVVVLVDLDNSQRPKLLAFPNVDLFASSSSSVQVVGQESVRNSIDVHANDDLCSILSNLGLHQNRIVEHCHNKPSPGYNTVSDTSVLPMDATTSHSRKTGRHLRPEQHKHCPYQAARLPPAVRELRGVAAEESRCVYLQPTSLE